ncbi:MAG TPA: ester cyclase [Ktedonobacteraceae bacterium]|nr:ester cyclase [Ktedonobacteraceae bacterium]
MSTEENKATARRFFEEVFNGGNLAVVDEVKSSTYVFHDPGFPEPIRGPEGFKQHLMLFRNVFPDLRSTVEDLIAEGENVTVRFTFTGTQQDTLMGIPPTGKQVGVTAILIGRLVNGKFVEGWINYDGLGMLQQLGVIPPMG